MIQRPEDKIFYGVPADANITVTVTGAQEGHHLSIGADFTKGEVQKDGSVLGKGDAYCYDAVQWAVERSVTAGKTATTFAPDDTCTRGQIATFLYRDLARG